MNTVNESLSFFFFRNKNLKIFIFILILDLFKMWQEMRKHEKKLRGLIVDYKRRSERRKEYYERIVRIENLVFAPQHSILSILFSL